MATLQEVNLRLGRWSDSLELLNLYKITAAKSGGIARTEDEIHLDYIQSWLTASIKSGLSLVAEYNGQLVASVHAYKMEAKVFSHILSQLTIVVAPDWQAKKLGRLIFTEFLHRVQSDFPEVQRVELIVRESNQKAQNFYLSLGFVVEGKLLNRIKTLDKNGQAVYEADIPMAWSRKL